MGIFLHESAEKTLEKIKSNVKRNIKKHLRKLAADPFSRQIDVKKLKGLDGKPDLFRLRVGEYRIIYFIQENNIFITEIMLRGKGYDF